MLWFRQAIFYFCHVRASAIVNRRLRPPTEPWKPLSLKRWDLLVNAQISIINRHKQKAYKTSVNNPSPCIKKPRNPFSAPFICLIILTI